MKNFFDWFKENYPNEEIPEKTINGTWFAKHCLPMVVACTCCTTTMCLINAMIDEDGQVFCHNCAEEDEAELD